MNANTPQRFPVGIGQGRSERGAGGAVGGDAAERI